MKVSYEWLQTFFEEGVLPPVDAVVKKLMFHAYEIEGVEVVNGDSIIDVDVLPNRAADSLSHRGIAREVATLFDISMKCDPLHKEISLTPETDSVTVSIVDDSSCSYYVAAHIKGITVKESPEWIKRRLEAIGQKSINNVVDATNYVLFELGRPTHVFDINKLTGDVPSIGVRLANDKEKIQLLGGEEKELTDTMTVITDAHSDALLAVAGVKGGTVAEVDEHTVDIIVEVANFQPTQTRVTAQTLKLRTDASARFENNMADELADYGAHAVTDLILRVAGGKLIGFVTAGAPQSDTTPVVVTSDHIEKLLGAHISTSEIESILKRLQCVYTLEAGTFTVTAPFERRDIKIPEDVIEEVGRVYGYNNIESKQLDTPEREVGIHKKFAYSEIIRNVLAELNTTEVYLYSLHDRGEVKLRNALASDKEYLRSNLADGIIESLKKNERNMPLLGLYDAVKIFEIGDIFLKGSEETHVCVGVCITGKKNKESKTRAELCFIKEKLEEVLGVDLPEALDGTLEFSIDSLLEKLPPQEEYIEGKIVGEEVVYNTVSQYPFVLRDIAMWVPEGITSEEVLNVVVKNSGELLQRVDLFDTFNKDGRVSYAFHLVFQSMKETLTDDVVGTIMKTIEKEVISKEDWEIR